MSSLDVAAYNLKGQVFCGATTDVVTVSAVTAITTGLILLNPPGSGVKVILVSFGFAFQTVPGAVHNLGLALTPPGGTVPTTITATHTCPIQSADGSGAIGKSVVKLYDAVTFVSPAVPVAVRWCFGAAWGSSVGVSPSMLLDPVEGAIVAVPGAAISACRVTTASVGVASFCWIEVPV
jgi:hypothetical protein